MFDTLFWLILKNIFFYVLIALILGLIPVNKNFRPDPTGYRIFIISNGIHTDIALPVNSGEYSWTGFFDKTDFKEKIHYAKYIAFGWGNKLFYLNTPEWKDLTPAIAFNALFIETKPAMHVTLAGNVNMDKNVRTILISGKDLHLLTEYILSSF